MKERLNLIGTSLGLLGSGAVLMAGALAFAAPVDSTANNCTFVGSVVNQATRADTEAGVERVPAGTATPGNCEVVHFSMQTDRASVAGVDGANTQKFLWMATIFEEHDAGEFDLVSIFDIVQPTRGVASRD